MTEPNDLRSIADELWDDLDPKDVQWATVCMLRAVQLEIRAAARGIENTLDDRLSEIRDRFQY